MIILFKINFANQSSTQVLGNTKNIEHILSRVALTTEIGYDNLIR